MIKKLPKHIINIISAWEVVERPYSVVKELIENSLDAQSSQINIEIKKWWLSYIKVEDNWVWIDHEDLPLTVERYATSKISSLEDLQKIESFWFRWEALSAIWEVSKFTIQTKTEKSNIGYQLQKIEKKINITQIPTPYNHWTAVIVQDLFFNLPVRRKYLKSPQTEYKYIYDTVIDFAILEYNVWFKLKHNDKLILDLKPTNNLYNRLWQIYPKEWEKHIINVEYKDEKLHIYWFVSKPDLKFNTINSKFFVNSRPVEDKIIKKAVLQAYSWQLPPNNYPFVLLFVQIPYSWVDVNVHPRKKEVKFQDPGSIYNIVYNTIKDSIFSKNIQQKVYNISSFKPTSKKTEKEPADNFNNKETNVYIQKSLFETENSIDIPEDIKIIWQIFDSFIVAQKQDQLLLIDQHAVAERIIYEKMKKKLKESNKTSILLTPITVSIWKIADLEEKLQKLQQIWFDVSQFGENKIIVYAIPEIFEKYQVDASILLNSLLYQETENIDIDFILDTIFATKACKTAIKANQPLSLPQMQQLIADWIKHIEWFFVCQHGRPSIVSLNKKDIEKMFDR